MKITVNRNQYGVGQGCFHAQRISVEFPGIEEKQEYRFVYDCGSDTEASEKKLSPYLDWAIKHFAGSKKRPITPVKIDTFYLSHFHADHISGLIRLSDLTDIREIVIPYIDRQLLTSLVMQYLATGGLSEFTDETFQYLRILEDFANNEGFLNRDIRITRIPASPEIQNPDQLTDEEAEWIAPGNLGGFTRFSIEPVQRQNNIGDHTQYSRLLQLNADSTLCPPIAFTFWELRTWAYQENINVTNEILARLTAIKDSSGDSRLPNLINGRIDQTEIQWAIDNLHEIQKAYKDGLIAAGVLNAKNHNAVSLCLYSGPRLLPATTCYRTSLGNYRSVTTNIWHPRWRKIHGWLGTGDAQLGITNIWSNFAAHFSYRINLSCTILMPHHGSSKGKNHNQDLLRHDHVNTVFSAGAFNQWQHPNLEVVESVSDRKGIPITVTELLRPGFFETITYSF